MLEQDRLPAKEQVLKGKISGILHGSYDVASFVYLANRVGFPPTELLKAAKNPDIRDSLFLEFGKDPGRFAYQLGVALSGSPYDSYDPLVIIYTPIMKDDSNLSVSASHPTWDLCDMSERFLKRSLDKGDGLVVVNNYLLAKKRGYKASLCLQTFATDASTFVKGNWYEPEGGARTAVKAALSKGRTSLHLDEGTWVLMRGMNQDKNPDDLMERVVGFTKGADVSPGIKRVQRQFSQKAKTLIEGIKSII